MKLSCGGSGGMERMVVARIGRREVCIVVGGSWGCVDGDGMMGW